MSVQELEKAVSQLPSRDFVQPAAQEKTTHFGESRLASECVKLDPAEERALAEEGMAAEVTQWPSY